MTKVLATMLALLSAAAQTPGHVERVPVLIELFTSEGCSSCPPADDVLTRLVATQPVAGVEVIALGEHVDYWDHLGWRDAFSSSTFSRRQQDYAERVFHGGDIYTPQLVVNGRRQLVGSDYRQALSTIADAAKVPSQLRLSMSVDWRSNLQPRLQLQVETRDGASRKNDAEIWIATIENGVTTRVVRGENGGRTLQHTAVVRSLRNIGTVRRSENRWSGVADATLSGNWNAASIRIVAFAQDHSTREILSAAAARRQ